MRTALRNKLEEGVRVSAWGRLHDFANRDAIILISEELDLLDVAERVVRDDKEFVASWVEDSLVTKPNSLQLRKWEETPSRPFRCLVVYPYILIQSVAS